jgi:hypothetical protein
MRLFTARHHDPSEVAKTALETAQAALREQERKKRSSDETRVKLQEALKRNHLADLLYEALKAQRES